MFFPQSGRGDRRSLIQFSKSQFVRIVIARSEARKQSIERRILTMDCFKEPVIGPAKGRTRWLAMTVSKRTVDHDLDQFRAGPLECRVQRGRHVLGFGDPQGL